MRLVRWRLFLVCISKETGSMPSYFFLVCVVLYIAAGLASGQDCPVRYRNGGQALLYGGAYNQCQSGCQPRNDFWGKVCAFRKDHDPKLVCPPEAAKRSYDLAKTLGGGEILQLSPCDVWRYLRGRTLWIIGDSHGRFLYRAMQCFLLDFWNHQECQSTVDDKADAELSKLPVAAGGSYCFHLLGPASGRVCMVHVVLGTSLVRNNEVTEGGVLPLLQKKFAQPQDIFYINFGIWHKNLKEWESSYIPALANLGNFYTATKARFPYVVFRETPAQHPRTGDDKACAPARGGYIYDSSSGELIVDPASRAVAIDYASSWALGKPINDVANTVLPWYGIPVLPAFNISVPLYDNHANIPMANGKLDCMHYCHPGVPQMWVWYLYDYMRSLNGVTPLPDTAAPGYSLPCRVMQSVD